MEITPTSEPALKATNSAASPGNATPVRPAELLSQLQAGQTLLAKVENVLANNQVELRIANQIVKADTPIQLAAGQPLKLLVEDSVNGLILRIAQQASQVETLAKAWRAALPRQQPINNVIKQLVETLAANKAEANNNSASNQIRIAIQTLVNTLPSVKTVSQAEGLRQAIQNSGVSLEAQLRQALITGRPPRTDNNLKANFLRLAQAALQLQANSQPGNNTTTTESARISSSLGKTNPIDAYTSLLSAATRPSEQTDKSLTTLRPLLPPLPLAVDATSHTQNPNRLLASLPTLLQRLFSLPTANTQALQRGSVATTSSHGPASQQVFSTLLVELLNQMESGLARIQQHQLNNISSDDAIRHFLNLELPVFNGKTFDNIGVRFEWEKYPQNEDDESKQHQWRVILNFDFDELGKTQVTIRAGQNEIHTDFKSETQQAQTLFQENKDMLKQGLKEHGLNPGQVTFSTGSIEAEASAANNKNIVKTKA